MNNIKGPKFKYLLGPARDSTPQGIPIQKPSITQPTKCGRQNLKYPDCHEKSSDFFESGMGQRCARQQNISANQLAVTGRRPSRFFFLVLYDVWSHPTTGMQTKYSEGQMDHRKDGHWVPWAIK